MNKYHKIQGLYKRDMDKNSPNYGKFIIGLYSLPEFEMLKDIQWVWTEKIDGTNIRIMFWEGVESVLKFTGKTDYAEIPSHLLEYLEKTFSVQKLNSIFKSEPDREFLEVCLYGEGYGYKIQSGGKYFPENPKQVGFILFDIKIGNIWLKREDVIDIGNKLNINIVPIVGQGTIDQAVKLVKNGFISKFGDFIAEGLVIRPKHELLDRRGHRIITKIKYKDFKENPK